MRFVILYSADAKHYKVHSL